MADWYVRPDASHGGANNGTSYANAWQGYASISWAGMADTDTLYVCGAFSLAANFQTQKNGTSNTARFTIDGGYSADPGSITFSGATYFLVDSNNINIQNLSITGGTATCIYHNSNKSNVSYLGCTVVGGTTGIQFAGGTGVAYSNIKINGSTISGQTGSGANAAIQWYIATAGATNTITDLEITNNTISGNTSSDQLVHFRAINTVGVGSLLLGTITISRNIFSNFRGASLRLAHEQVTSGAGGTLYIEDNTFTNGTEATNQIGGNSFRGFANGYIRRNIVKDVAGVGGGFNTFYGSYLVERNKIENITCTYIDGNGILFDHGCTNSTARWNTIKNIQGNGTYNNSGCGIMVLDSTGCKIYGNVTDTCRHGLWFYDAGASQSADCDNNTFLNCSVSGVHLESSATRASVYVRNSVFTGAGKFVDDAAGAWTNENYNLAYGMAANTNHTNGANDLTSDPLLDVNYRPTSSSPCISAGTYIAGTRYYGGETIRGTPTIGARQYHTPRTIASRGI